MLTKLHKENIPHQAYANDTIILLQSKKDLKVATSLITDFFKLLGLKINREKCTILVMEAKTQFKSHPFTKKALERYLEVQLNIKGNFTLLPTTMNDNI